jgi:hypothetical protein
VAHRGDRAVRGDAARRVWLTRNGLWVAARRPDGRGTDREFIPGMALRLLAAKRLAFTTRTERERG